MSRLFLASRNAKKIAEMQRILAAYVPDITVLGLDSVTPYDEPVEDQPSFEGNALLKARVGAKATGLTSIADDSGLCVDALNAMPGVLSARWSGLPKSDERNNQLLLDQLHDVPEERRTAHFTCAVALVHPDGRELVVDGRMEGRIITSMRGEGGFGYDVLFVPDSYAAAQLTSAQLQPAEKDAISHRGAALRELAPLVSRYLT